MYLVSQKFSESSLVKRSEMTNEFIKHSSLEKSSLLHMFHLTVWTVCQCVYDSIYLLFICQIYF